MKSAEFFDSLDSETCENWDFCQLRVRESHEIELTAVIGAIEQSVVAEGEDAREAENVGKEVDDSFSNEGRADGAASFPFE